MINKVIEGYNATIFAYGQTNSGKTYTMDGYKYVMKDGKSSISFSKKEYWGIIPRSIEYLCNRVNEEAKKGLRKYSIYCSYLQIYNERIYDLLNSSQLHSSSPGLKLRYKNDNFSVENLYTFECNSEREIYELLHTGLKNRVIASHKLNYTSSRSHSIFCLTVESTSLTNSVSTLTHYRKIP